MSEIKVTKTVVIYSKLASARDHLRNYIVAKGATAFCFETETACFDNLESIKPDVVLALTDSKALVWRFVFAIQSIGANSALLVLSDLLNGKPFSFPGLHVLTRCIPGRIHGDRLNETIDEIIEGKAKLPVSDSQPLFIGETEPVKTIRSMLPGLISAKEAVLISGEPGTGKELLARIIAGGARGNGAVIKVNCAHLGMKRDTRTGLYAGHCIDGQNKLFQDDGVVFKSITIILDKINNLHMDVQGEILLLLDRDLQSIFNLDPAKSNGMRFIATSEEKLEPLVRRGKFRKDLYYRLNVIPVHIPPLRQRVKDIPLLLDFFAIDACARTKKSFIIPSESTKESLCIYKWPGNVGELKQLMLRLAISGDESFVFAQNGIERVPKYSPAYLLNTIDTAALPDTMDIKRILPTMSNLSLKRICDKFSSKTEKKLMQKALETTNWNRKKAAALLNISYKSMLNKMKMYEII